MQTNTPTPKEGSPEPAQPMRTGAVSDQVVGAVTDLLNLVRRASEAKALDAQDAGFDFACAEIENVRKFLEGTIGGSEKTKHGVIAEVVEVATLRAKDWLAQQTPDTWKVEKLDSPTDIFVNGVGVQVKTINGTRAGLDYVLEHARKYGWFGRDGDKSYWAIPKDQHEQIQRVLNGDPGELSAATVRAIKKKVAEIEQLTGRPAGEVLRPLTFDYPDVQRNAVGDTLDKRDAEFQKENEERKEAIRDDHAPSLQGALKATVLGAGIAAGFGFATSAGKKYFKEGKNIFRGDFTKEDWSEVGVDTGKAGAVGGVSAAAIYGMTNYACMAAPVAAAFVSAARGVSSLVARHQAGKLTDSQLVDESLLVCTDVGVVALCGALGQTLIPVPVLGTFIGSMAGKAAMDLLGSANEKAQKELKARLEAMDADLKAQHDVAVDAIRARLLPIQSMTDYAFDPANNLRCLESSASLARLYKVPEELILKDRRDVLAFLQAT